MLFRSGDIAFHYTHIGQLKNEIEPEKPLALELDKKVKVLSLAKEYDVEIIHLFHAAGDFRYRPQWQEGVREVQEVSHFLPRVGMGYKSIRDDGYSVFYASSYTFHPDRIEFGETDEKKTSSTRYVLEKINEKRTKLVVDHYIRKSLAGPLFFDLFKKRKMKKIFNRSLANLDKVAKEIKLPGEI